MQREFQENKKRPESKTLAYALQYLKRGWNVVPVKYRTKDKPIEWKKYQTQRITEKEVYARFGHGLHNVAIITGRISDLIVLDADVKKHHEAAEYLKHKHVPDTIKNHTHNGIQYVFQYPADLNVTNIVALGGVPGIDIRGDGGYIMVAPSMHPEGTQYKWENPKEGSLLKTAPEWLLDAIVLHKTSREKDKKYDYSRAFSDGIPDGMRNNTLTSLGGKLKAGLEFDEALLILESINQTRCKPPLQSTEVESILKSVYSYENGHSAAAEGFNSKVLEAAIEKDDTIAALREIAKLRFASERELWLQKLSEKVGVTIDVLTDDVNTIKREKEQTKYKTQSAAQKKPVDLLSDQKRSIHPATDLLDGKLYFGTSNGANSLLIFERKVLKTSEISQQYELSGFPNPMQFSVNGIKTYLNGGEIRGPKLYNQIHNLLSGHVIFKTPWQIVLTVFWIIGTYLHRCFPLYPYLWIQSPTKRCGKTRLLELLAALGFNSDGIHTAPTEAVLFRQAAITAGTLCWDEAESLENIKDKSERNAILNVAYRKNGKVSRCKGENHEVKDYEVFRPIALAGISALPDTASDRSLKIELIRKRRDEKVKRLQINHLQCGLQSLRDGLHIFALERAPIILEFYSQFRDELIPEEVDDRLREAFEIIISIAAGIYYHDKSDFPPILSSLQMAAKGLSGIRALDEDETSFIKAIDILRSKIKESKQDQLIITSKDAIQIFQTGGLTWVQEPKHAQSILKKLDLRSGPHRINGELIRGYKIAAKYIEDQFLRYGSTFAE